MIRKKGGKNATNFEIPKPIKKQIKYTLKRVVRCNAITLVTKHNYHQHLLVLEII